MRVTQLLYTHRYEEIWLLYESCMDPFTGSSRKNNSVQFCNLSTMPQCELCLKDNIFPGKILNPSYSFLFHSFSLRRHLAVWHERVHVIWHYDDKGNGFSDAFPLSGPLSPSWDFSDVAGPTCSLNGGCWDATGHLVFVQAINRAHPP